jgi:hypothetical protein
MVFKEIKNANNVDYIYMYWIIKLYPQNLHNYSVSKNVLVCDGWVSGEIAFCVIRWGDRGGVRLGSGLPKSWWTVLKKQDSHQMSHSALSLGYRLPTEASYSMYTGGFCRGWYWGLNSGSCTC